MDNITDIIGNILGSLKPGRAPRKPRVASARRVRQVAIQPKMGDLLEDRGGNVYRVIQTTPNVVVETGDPILNKEAAAWESLVRDYPTLAQGYIEVLDVDDKGNTITIKVDLEAYQRFTVTDMTAYFKALD